MEDHADFSATTVIAKLKDYARIYHFPEETLSYPYDIPQSFPLEHLKVTVAGVPVPHALKGEPGKTGTLYLRTGLNAGETKEIVCSYDPAYKVTEVFTGVSLTPQKDGTLVIASDKQTVRVPYGNHRGGVFEKLPAPIIECGYDNLVVKGNLTGNLKCTGMTGIILEQNLIFVRYQIKYEFGSNKSYTVELKVQTGEKHVTVDEYVEGMTGDDLIAFELDYTALDPQFRFSVPQDVHKLCTTYDLWVGFDKNYGTEQNPDIQHVYEKRDGNVGRMGVDIYYTAPVSFFNSEKQYAISFVPYDHPHWKYTTYMKWPTGPENEMLRFEYRLDGRKFMRAAIVAPERHWAVSVIPMDDMVIDGIYTSEYKTQPFPPKKHVYPMRMELTLTRNSHGDVSDYSVGFVGVDDMGKIYPFTTYGESWGSDPGIRLWQKLTDFSLNVYKDIDFEFDEPTAKRDGVVIQFPIYEDEDVHIYTYDAYVNRFHSEYAMMADRFWNGRGDLGPNHIGWLKAHEAVYYTNSRAAWTEEQRRHVRSWYIMFMKALENQSPIGCRWDAMTGGQPNFLHQWIKNFPIWAVVFPKYPDADKWVQAGRDLYKLAAGQYVRKDETENGAQGGRFMENPICYSYGSMEDFMLGTHAMAQWDGHKAGGGMKYANGPLNDPNVQKWLAWHVDVMLPGLEYMDYKEKGMRIAPSQGAHARIRSFLPGERYWVDYCAMAGMQLAYGKEINDETAIKLGKAMLWSIRTPDASPLYEPPMELKSKLYTDYGPVMHYHAGKPDEAYLQLQQLHGSGYRWPIELSGALYYSADGYSWSWNRTEDAGDEFTYDGVTLPYSEGMRSALRSKPKSVLYDFDFAQAYRMTPDDDNDLSALAGRGVMMVRNDYIAVRDELRDDRHTEADWIRFNWINHANMGLLVEHFQGKDFTNRVYHTYGTRLGGDERSQFYYNIHPHADTSGGRDSWNGITNMDTFSARVQGVVKAPADTLYFKFSLGKYDSASIYIDRGKGAGKELVASGNINNSNANYNNTPSHPFNTGGPQQIFTVTGLKKGEPFTINIDFAHDGVLPSGEYVWPDGGVNFIQFVVNMGVSPDEFRPLPTEYVHNQMRMPEITDLIGNGPVNAKGWTVPGGIRGDQLHLVAPDTNPLKDSVEPVGDTGRQWGAKFLNRKGVTGKEAVEYVFFNRSGVSGSYSDTGMNVYFNGTEGYAGPRQIALFEGTVIRYGELAIRKTATDEFGISAEYSDGKVTGRYTGKKGATGKVSISLPTGFTTGKPRVDIASGDDVSWNVDTRTVTFTVPAVTQQNEIKNYTVLPSNKE